MSHRTIGLQHRAISLSHSHWIITHYTIQLPPPIDGVGSSIPAD